MDTVQGADRVHLGEAAITSLKEGFNPTQLPTAGHLMAPDGPGGASHGLLLVSAGTVAQLCSRDPHGCETSCRNISSARGAAVKPQRQARLRRQAPAARADSAGLHARNTGCGSQGHRATRQGRPQSWPRLLLPAARCSSPLHRRAGLWREAAPRHQSGVGECKAMTSAEFSPQPPAKLPRDGETQTRPCPYSPGMGKLIPDVPIPSFPLTSTGMISVPAAPFASPAPRQRLQPSTVSSSKHQAGLGKRNLFSSS